MKIQNYRNDIDNCRFCWMCRQVCSVSVATNNETLTPRSRSFILSSILKGMIDYTGEVAEVVYKCCLCGYCKSWCKGGWNPPPFVKAARQDLVERGFVPEKVNELKDSMVNEFNPFGMKKEEKGSELVKAIASMPETGDTLLLFGSAVLYKVPEVGISALELFKKAGIKAAAVKDEASCGFELFCIGYEKEAKMKTKMLLEQIAGSKCKEVVALSPDDYYFLTEDIKELGMELKDTAVYNVVDYIAKLAEQGSIKFTKEIKSKVSYHDTTYFARYCGVIDAPRNLIKAVPGIEYKELLWLREEAHSAGNAVMMYTYPDVCGAMVKTVLDDAIEARVDILVTASAEDKRNINESPYKPSNLKVVDLVELLNESAQ